MKQNTRQWTNVAIGILALAGAANAASQSSERYVYDESGNIIEKSIDGKLFKMRYDSANRVMSTESDATGGELIAYDSSGRPLSYTDASSGKASRELKYGYADKVLESRRGSEKSTFYYNSEGQLVGTSTAGKSTLYAWDGNVVAAKGQEVFTNEDHFSGGVPVMAADQSVVVSDYLGNTLSIGHDRMESTAYGEGSSTARLTGKPYVEELEAYVFQHRLYSPVLSRWTTSDPLGYPDSENNIAYMSDPNSGVDALGTIVKEISNSVSSPAPALVTISGGSPSFTIGFSRVGLANADPGFGFVAKITHSSTNAQAPPLKEIKLKCLITADDPNKRIFYTGSGPGYQSLGTGSSMAMTAKMTGNGTPVISANVTGAYATTPSVASGLGFTDVPQAAGASVSAGGQGNAFPFGTGNWIWSEN